MGEVFRATDTKLGREVALKVLPAEFSADPERLARFEREAKVLASLNHPGIAHLYGFESTVTADPSSHGPGGLLGMTEGRQAPGGLLGMTEGRPTHFLVMELVEGEDLAERLKRGTIPVDEAIAIARQVAEALEEAHERGIVHRDLKPANVKVTPEGKAKVLDFGLAKAWSGEDGRLSGSAPALSQSPTLAATGSAAGLILGTAAYMSPEQARGKSVDKRADIWAFGVVLFEMLLGRRLFEGETVSDTLAAVLRQEIDWSALPAATPPHVRRLLERCLERDPKRRLRDVGEARLALEGAPAGAAPPISAAVAPRRRRWLPAAAFLAGFGLAALAAWPFLGREAPHRPVRRFSLGDTPFTMDALQGLALSPDGGRLVFRGLGEDGMLRLYERPLDSLETRALPGTEQGWLPFFSPDGAWLAFFTQGSLKKLSLSGGAPLTVASVTSATGGTWLSDGTIVFASETKGLERVDASGGAPEALTRPSDGPMPLITSPWALPGGRALLVGLRRGGGFFDVAVFSLSDGSLRVVTEDGFSPTYVRSGHVVYQQGRASTGLLALPFDLERLAATGTAFPVLSDIGTRVSFQGRTFSVADDGTLAYVQSTTVLEHGALLWVDPGGALTPIVEIPRALDTPRLSPDGRRIAFRTPAPNCDLWVHDLRRGSTTRVTLEGDNHGVTWSPDGRRLAFARQEGSEMGNWALLSAPADGSGAVERLVPGAVLRANPTSFSPDGRWLLVDTRGGETGGDIDLVSVPERTTVPLLRTPFDERGGEFSPDGKFVAYVSNESGRDEVYVARFPQLDARQQISTDGGAEPGWAPGGRRLFYRDGARMMVVEVGSGEPLEASRPRALFEGEFAGGVGRERGYDIAPDGPRFVMARARSQGGGEVNVVLNWLEGLRLRSPETR